MKVISEFKQGQQVQCRLVLSDASVRKTNTRPPRNFLQATLTDGADTITGMFWNWPSDNAPDTKKIYDLVANVGEFSGKAQLTITSMTATASQDMSEFNIHVDHDPEDLWQQALQTISQIDNQTLKTIVLQVYTAYHDKILAATSAKAVHHVGMGGNLQHTLEVANIAMGILYNYPGAPIDRSLVIAGAMLHDIGKIFVYRVEGPIVDYTLAGQLHEHIVVGIRILESIRVDAQGSADAEIDLLQHIIASHHGELEFGSPVTPKFAEAYIVNVADGISARLNTILAASDKAGSSMLTEKMYPFSTYPNLTQQYVHTYLGSEGV